LYYLGKHEAAKTMYLRAVKRRKKALKKDYPDTLNSANSLARVLNEQDKHETAEAMYRRAAEGNEQTLGKDHPNTLRSAHNLAVTLKNQGKDGAAVQLRSSHGSGKRKCWKWMGNKIGKRTLIM
jgi:tetratricopeptide (TPR) repeat protein